MARASSSRAFWWGVALLALWIVALSLYVASREWFSRDDFAFLNLVQDPERWSWRGAFFPSHERFWPFYRPLGMESYFWLGNRLFGLEAFGYFALSLAVHFASGGLVYRIARQLGCDARVATAAALLAVSRPSTLDQIYWGSVFMYVSQVFFCLLAATAFLDQLRSGRPGAQLVACLAVGLALLCNEVAATMPAVLLWLALASGEWRAGGVGRLARALAPATLVVGAYGLFRVGWLPASEQVVWYGPGPGLHVVPNAVALLAMVSGGPLPALLAGAAGVAILAFAAARGDAGLRRWIVQRAGGSAAWLATWLGAFATLAHPQGRWTVPLAAPLCLLLGVALEALGRVAGFRRPRRFEALLLLLLVAASPTAVLLEHAQHPRGELPRALHRWVEGHDASLPRAARLVILYGEPPLADAAAGKRLRDLSYNGGVLTGMDPRTRRTVRFHDVTRREPRAVVRPGSVYLALRDDLGFARAEPALLDRVLRRRFAPER